MSTYNPINFNSRFWYGIVENSNDPVMSGRVQVRIFGIHPLNPDGTPDRALVPTEALPWAQTSHSPNAALIATVPKEGDWVHGTFMEESLQKPIILGVLPGIQGVQSAYFYGTAPQRSEEEGTPVAPNGIVVNGVGEPTTARNSRGVLEGTMVKLMNGELSAVCDISTEVGAALGWVRNQFGVLVQAIRNAIRAAIKALGFDPTGIVSSVVSTLKKLNDTLRWVRNILQEVQDWKNLLIDTVRKIRAVIDFILSIPQKFLQFVRECLAYFSAGITAFISGVTSIISDVDLDLGFAEIQSEFSQIGQNIGAIAGQVVDIGTAPLQAIEVFLTPSSDSDLKGAEETILNLFDNEKTNADTQASTATTQVNNVATNTSLP